MDTVRILRNLWRLRVGVAVIAVLSILIGVLISYKLPSFESRKYEVGVATARILVDTPASQVVDLSPKGSDALGARTTLLANLMVDGDMKTAIARRAGLRPDQLIGMSQDASAPDAAAHAPTRHSYVLATQLTAITNDSWLPIIEISTQAPTRDAAQRLATAAVAGLRDYLDTKAAAENIPKSQRLRVSGLGLAQASEVTRGPRLIVSVLAAVLLFAAGCAGLLGFTGLIERLRNDPEDAEDVDEPYVGTFAASAEGGAYREDEFEWFDDDQPGLVPTIASDNGGPPVVPFDPVDGNDRR